MKIINLNDFFMSPITADSTMISADSTLFTADMTHILTDDHFIKVIPREYPTPVTIEFFFEISLLKVIETSIPVKEKGYMIIPFEYDEFKEGDSLEITVRNPATNKIIWRGKGYVTNDDDLQNYKMLPPTPPNDIIIM